MPQLDPYAERITRHAESRDRDYNPDGTPVRSPKGALYAMQTMPTTAGDPGFGVKPVANNTPAEFNRVGREYLAAMMERYGDPTAAWAAYNWGPGRVDRAKAKYGEGWLAHAPAGVQSYARGNARSYAQKNGSTAPVATSVMDDDYESGAPSDGALSSQAWSGQMNDALSESARVEQSAAAQRKAMYEQGLAALQQQYAGPDRSALFGMLGRAFLSPSTTPGFGGTLRNISEGLNDLNAQQREASMARAQALAQLQRQYGEDTISGEREGVRNRIEVLKALKPASGGEYTASPTGVIFNKRTGFPTPNPAQVNALLQNPNKARDFDIMFGPGAAAEMFARYGKGRK